MAPFFFTSFCKLVFCKLGLLPLSCFVEEQASGLVFIFGLPHQNSEGLNKWGWPYCARPFFRSQVRYGG